MAEQCVGAPGDRKVLRFSVEAVNQGQATLNYFLQVTLNPGRAFEELSFENNTAMVPVTVP